MIVGIENRDDLVRDTSSGAVLNSDRSAYDNYMIRKKQEQLRKEQQLSQQQEINNLKSELSEIKQLLQILVRDHHG